MRTAENGKAGDSDDNSLPSEDNADAYAQHAHQLMRSPSAKVERLGLEWKAIGCSYRVAGGIKQVLDDIWGKADPGEMQVRDGAVAILPSLIGV